MKTILPFRHEDESTILSKVHPSIRIITPFILVIPWLILDDLYLIITILFITLTIDLLFRLKILRIFSRTKNIIPLIILLIIFLPLYIGSTIAYQLEFNSGFSINFYQEGIDLAILLFFRIFVAIFVFMSFFSSLTYSEFIEGITKLRFPSILVGSLIILLHYIPILSKSNKKLLEAQELRGKKTTSYWLKLKTHAFIMAKSLVINMERSEKLYESLKMRGYSGKITFAARGIKIIDVIVLSLSILLMIVLIKFVDLPQFYTEVVKPFTQ